MPHTWMLIQITLEAVSIAAGDYRKADRVNLPRRLTMKLLADAVALAPTGYRAGETPAIPAACWSVWGF